MAIDESLSNINRLGLAARRARIWHPVIIVSGASTWMEPYHDRMSVLMEEADFIAWLNGSLGPETLQPGSRIRTARLNVGIRRETRNLVVFKANR